MFTHYVAAIAAEPAHALFIASALILLSFYPSLMLATVAAPFRVAASIYRDKDPWLGMLIALFLGALILSLATGVVYVLTKLALGLFSVAKIVFIALFP